MKSRVQPLPLRSRIVWRWLCVGGYAACIFVLSSIPGQSLPMVHVSDKLIHAGEYGLFGILLCRALALQLTKWPRSRIAHVSLLVVIGYGAIDEFHQLFVHARSAELADLAADSLGAALAVWGWLKLSARWIWLE